MNDTSVGDYFVNDNPGEERYLTFTVGGRVYGLSIFLVTEIIGISDITKVPGTPDFIKGVVNLRGKIIPVVDVRLKFGKKAIPYTDRTCVVVACFKAMIVGLIVDSVDDVAVIQNDEVALDELGKSEFENIYIEGVGKIGDRMVCLLDLDRFLRADGAGVPKCLEESMDSE